MTSSEKYKIQLEVINYIKENMTGRVVNGFLEGVVTEDGLEVIRKEIEENTFNCGTCKKSCMRSWCPTRD